MFRKSFLAIVLIAVVILPGTVSAQETEKQRMLVEIVNATNSMDQFEGMKDVLSQQMESQLAGSGVSLTPEQKEGLLVIVFDMVEEMMVRMTPRAVQFYDERFSEPEIREIYAFIKSPTGEKMTAATPELALILSQEMTPMMMEMLPDMQQKIIALIAGTASE